MRLDVSLDGTAAGVQAQVPLGEKSGKTPTGEADTGEKQMMEAEPKETVVATKKAGVKKAKKAKSGLVHFRPSPYVPRHRPCWRRRPVVRRSHALFPTTRIDKS